jgi:hypothetical protein
MLGWISGEGMEGVEANGGETHPVCPGTGVSAKKSSVESAKPVKFPTGVIRPDTARHQCLPCPTKSGIYLTIGIE